jgi:hypothetical protein
MAPLFFSINFSSQAGAQASPDVFVGIDVGYGVNVQEAKRVIDRVSSYTNFFVIGTTAISRSLSDLNETLQYAHDKGMYFMSFPPTLGFDPVLINQSKFWLNYTKTNWGNHLVGFLYPWEDEPGGHQLDKGGEYYPVPNMNATDYADAESQFLNSSWFRDLNRAKTILNYPLFTSDYALYWYDYKGGYDGLFAEFGWNYSTQINVALCRGAATVQNKQWGVVITFTYTNPPYIEPAADLYKDLVYAYDNGAKYIIVLDTNENWSSGCLTEEHFQAMRDFWEYIKNNPRRYYPVTERIAYKLPTSYGYGFRGPLDKFMALGKIWGVWEVDMTSFMISTSVGIMLERYGSKLDIIYDEPPQPGRTYAYSKVVMWDDYAAVAEEWPTFSPWPGLTPEPILTPTSTPIETPINTAIPSPDQTPNPADTQPPEASPRQTHDQKKPIFQQEYFWVATAGTIVACIGTFAIIYSRKRNSNRKG